MELTFEKQDNFYVSEFKITSDANLHIEKSTGKLQLFQRTIDAGGYAKIKDFDDSGYDSEKIIDFDFQSLIYPKWIKIVSAVNPTVAVVTMASSNSEGGSDDTDTDTDTSGPIEYHFEIPMVDAEDPMMGMKYQEGEIEGDFSELVERLYKYAMKNGYDTGSSFDVDPVSEEDVKITVNGDSGIHGLCAYYDENGNVDNIDMLTDGNMWMEEARLVIYPTKAVYTEGR